MLARQAISLQLLDEFDYLDSDHLNTHLRDGLDSVLAQFAQPTGFQNSNTLHCFAPSFKHYDNSQWQADALGGSINQGCGGCGSAWPAVSITAGECALQCEHCKANILKPMIPATTAEALWQLVCGLEAAGGQGILLTGGSDHGNRVDYSGFLGTIERIKKRYPDFTIACHTGLVSRQDVQHLERAGVDVVMMDVIGAQDTVARVYHLKRDVRDFEQSLGFLCESSMRVVPHIILGLHFGQLLGEWRALQWVKRYHPDALVLAVLMPHFTGKRQEFVLPDICLMARFFQRVRTQLPQLPVKLGCGRPPGLYGRLLDLWALLCGFEGIAYPAEGLVQIARYLGKDVRFHQRCCSVN